MHAERVGQKTARPFGKQPDFLESAANLNLASGQWMLSWHRPNKTKNPPKKKVATFVSWLLTEFRNRASLMPMNVTGAKQSARKRRQRIAGIGRAAAALQVTRQHLRLVIRSEERRVREECRSRWWPD